MSSRNSVPGPRPSAPPGSLLSPARLAYASATRPVLTLFIWAVIVAVGIFGASQLELSFGKEIRGSESAQGNEVLEDKVRGPKLPSETVVITANDGTTVDDPAYQAKVASVLEALRAMPETVASATSYFETGEPAEGSGLGDLPASVKTYVVTETLKGGAKVGDRLIERVVGGPYRQSDGKLVYVTLPRGIIDVPGDKLLLFLDDLGTACVGNNDVSVRFTLDSQGRIAPSANAAALDLAGLTMAEALAASR